MTAEVAPMLKEQAPVPLHVPPVHPENVEPPPAEGTQVMRRPAVLLPDVQFVPPTVPLPGPAVETVRV